MYFRVGRFATLGVLYGCDTLAVCRAYECKISEMVEFLNSDREHMQQGIFPDVQQSSLLHSALNFDDVSLTQCTCTFIILTCNLVANHFSHAMNVTVIQCTCTCLKFPEVDISIHNT